MRTVNKVPRKLLIIGAGGSGREVAWLARDVLGAEVDLIFGVEPEWIIAPTIDDVPVVSFDNLSHRDATHYVIAIGDIPTRRRLAAVCDSLGLHPITLIHPGVVHSSRVEVGPGSIVCAGAIITTNIRIGCHVHINIGCTLSHDVSIGDFSTLSPGVRLSGHVHVADGVFIGTGANTINGTIACPLEIGSGATVAAGACVTRPVPPGAMVAGIPAIRKR